MPIHQSTAEPTLLKHMSRLNVKDQIIICLMVQQHSLHHKHIHRGLLPFIPIRVACEALKMSSSSRCQRIQHKLRTTHGFPSGVKTINIFLDDVKVFKRFGIAPEKGVVIPYAPRHFDDQNVIKSPIMTLCHLSKGHWQVIVWKSYESHALRYLVDNCR